MVRRRVTSLSGFLCLFCAVKCLCLWGAPLTPPENTSRRQQRSPPTIFCIHPNTINHHFLFVGRSAGIIHQTMRPFPRCKFACSPKLFAAATQLIAPPARLRHVSLFPMAACSLERASPVAPSLSSLHLLFPRQNTLPTQHASRIHCTSRTRERQGESSEGCVVVDNTPNPLGSPCYCNALRRDRASTLFSKLGAKGKRAVFWRLLACRLHCSTQWGLVGPGETEMFGTAFFIIAPQNLPAVGSALWSHEFGAWISLIRDASTRRNTHKHQRIKR